MEKRERPREGNVGRGGVLARAISRTSYCLRQGAQLLHFVFPHIWERNDPRGPGLQPRAQGPRATQRQGATEHARKTLLVCLCFSPASSLSIHVDVQNGGVRCVSGGHHPDLRCFPRIRRPVGFVRRCIIETAAVQNRCFFGRQRQQRPSPQGQQLPGHGRRRGHHSR